MLWGMSYQMYVIFTLFNNIIPVNHALHDLILAYFNLLMCLKIDYFLYIVLYMVSCLLVTSATSAVIPTADVKLNILYTHTVILPNNA